MTSIKTKSDLLTQANRDLIDWVGELTAVWIEWVDCHRVSNDESKPFSVRRKHAVECESLQNKRQAILDKIDRMVDERWVDNG